MRKIKELGAVSFGDYAGFLATELLRVRELSDLKSKELAIKYAADPILRHFSIPRFKAQSMEVTAPMRVDQVSFDSTKVLSLSLEGFRDVLMLFGGAWAFYVSKNEPVTAEPVLPNIETGRSLNWGTRFGRKVQSILSGALERTTNDFWEALTKLEHDIPRHAVVRNCWESIFREMLVKLSLTDRYDLLFPTDAGFENSWQVLSSFVEENSKISRFKIHTLLVDPVTAEIEGGTSSNALFVIRFEIKESGFNIREIKKEDGSSFQMIEFD